MVESRSSVSCCMCQSQAPSMSLTEVDLQRPCWGRHWLLCKQVLCKRTEGCKDTVEDISSCSGGRCLSSYLKVTCSPPCGSSRCCWGCNIWLQSMYGCQPSIVLQAAGGAVKRGHLLDRRVRTKRQTAPAQITLS